MHTQALGFRVGALAALAALTAASLAGCSGSSATSALPSFASATIAGQAPGSPMATHDSHAKQELLYVSDEQDSSILVFDAATKTPNPPPLYTITNGLGYPNGITTDKAGNLYAANWALNTLTVYAPNATSPKLTLTRGLIMPIDVKVDAFGNIYVANQGSGSIQPYILRFPPGSTYPNYEWTMPASGITLSGIALVNPKIKNETQIYALGYIYPPSSFPIGGLLTCGPTPQCQQDSGYTFGSTGGIAIAHSPVGKKPFQFLVADQFLPGIDVFTTGHALKQLVTPGYPQQIALSSNDNALFVTDYYHGHVIKYGFPVTTQLNSYNVPHAYGVATYPNGTLH